MTLFLAHTRLLFLAHTRLLSATSTFNSALPRLQRMPARPSLQLSEISKRVHPGVHHIYNVVRCCAIPVDASGGLESGSGDGTAGNILAPVLKNSGASTVTDASDSALQSDEEPWIALTESRIERAIFDFRFLTLMAIAGSLVGSLLCFLKGCGFVRDSYIAYFAIHLTGVHTGKVILRLVEAVEIYLVGTVMLIFAMGLFGLFISNDSQNGSSDRALKNTTLFGMFPLTTRPLWMQITSLDTLKTKLGHCIVMILIVKLFEKSKTVCIASSMDLLLYSVAIFMTAGSLYVLQKLHDSQFSNT